MTNLAMFEMLKRGEALDVRRVGREITPAVFELQRFVDGVDYCDGLKERWIWSVGQRFSDNKIFAATDARFYGDPNYSCLYLR